MRRIFFVFGLLLLCVGNMFAEKDQRTDVVPSWDIFDEDETYGNMYRWRSHAAFTQINEVVVMGDKAYGLSSNSLFSVNKQDGEIEYYTKLNGLSSSVIDHIAYNEELDRMLITYRNGQIDIMTSDENVHNISDLFLKQISASKQVNDICMYQDKAILAMSFGLLVVDMKKVEISDTYYIGNNGSEVDVDYVTVTTEAIYAATNEYIYTADLTDNLLDYEYWKVLSFPKGKVNGMRTHQNALHLLVNQKLYILQGNDWSPVSVGAKNPPLFRHLCATKNGLYALPNNRYGVWKVDSNMVNLHLTYAYNYAIQEDGNAYWLGSSDNGLIHLYGSKAPEYQTDIQEYYPDGPINNFAYRLRFFDDKLYMLPGGRWASEYKRPGDIMIYEDGIWTNIKNADLVKAANGHKLYDFMNVAQDPNDASHYFVTTYGTGLLEMRDTNVIKIHLPSNSKLVSAAPAYPDYYTRTDGAMYDDQGNLWLLNMGAPNAENGKIHVISPDGEWHSFELLRNHSSIVLNTAGEILVDKRNPQWKWIPVLRADAGLILLQDNGTPINPHDDKVTYRNEWVDQNNKLIQPNNIYAIAQDYVNTIWVGTSSGIFAIPMSVDFTASNQCKRVVIRRNDGSGLGDYLLDNEQINAIAVDGANRLWVGTSNSGVYLLNPIGSVEDDVNYTMETVAHFTTNNSILPTDEIISIAIQESSGEVFIGTSGGLVSYMSDATKPEETYDELYAYPNPVHPTYQGYITIKGLMDDSEVRIVDASGNLVKILYGTGGTVVWDGTNAQGQRVGAGVYTGLCNTKSGSGHGTIKILILNKN